MGWVITDTASGMAVIGIDNDGYHQFSANPQAQWWWPTAADANWYIDSHNLEGVEADDAGSNPPGPGQPGQP